jgi:hypothetical protein
MRYLMITVVCFAGMFFLTSCKEQLATETTDEYLIVKKVTGAMTDSDIKACLSVANLDFDRFEFMLPERTEVHFLAEEFKDGQSAGVLAASKSLYQKGLQKFILCKYQNCSKLKFSIQGPYSIMGFEGSDMEGYMRLSHSMVPVKKPLSSEKQPIYILGANKVGGEVTNVTDFDLETLLKKYDYAMVIYISVKD